MVIANISHVSEWISIVEKANSTFTRNQHFLFRGESKQEYKLLPSLYRKADSGEMKYYSVNAERSIITDFMTEAAGFVNTVPVGDTFTWVEYAQHFGVPTRLMDWTSNPMVALFFACESNKESDGRIYILNQTGYKLLVDGNNKNGMEGKILKDESVKMILDSERTFPYPVIFKPYYLDRRMLAQSSRFMVWGSKRETLDKIIGELEQDGRIKEMSSYCDCNGVIIREAKEVDVLSEVHIASKDKLFIQRELDNMGINKALLFPGLDGIGRTIEWRYNKNNQRRPL